MNHQDAKTAEKKDGESSDAAFSFKNLLSLASWQLSYDRSDEKVVRPNMSSEKGRWRIFMGFPPKSGQKYIKCA